MAQLITASINLTKIDKSKITEKDGNKYLSVQVAINDEEDTYGNTVAISINQSKEERERKDKKVYLGNGKVVWSSEPKPKTNNASPPLSSNDDKDDLPF